MGKPADYQTPASFAPGLGISGIGPTGSAHALVAPWWCANGNAAQRGWAAGVEPGGGMALRTAVFQHDPVDRLGAINLGLRP